MLRVFGQRFLRSVTVAVKDVSTMDAVQDQVENTLTARHNGAQDFFVRNMADLLETATSAQNTLTILLGSVAAISLLVGGIGVMNIMLVSVTERTREIGIRVALGARTLDVMRLVVRKGFSLTAIGVGIGLAGAVVLTRIMASLLFGVNATDPITYVSIAVLLMIVAMLACYLPARRAAKVDPIVALRYE